MGILSAENNTTFDANTTCKIYIIKEVDYEEIYNFESVYADLLNNNSDSNVVLNTIKNNLQKINSSDNTNIKLIPLLYYTNLNERKYIDIQIDSSAPDAPTLPNGQKLNKLYFYKDLYELRNCPLLNFNKVYYVFQIENKTNLYESYNKSGLANILSFTSNFNVNGASTCEIQINNRDFKYNFKYFNEKNKFKYHLKPFFNTNDIIIIRAQKKNLTKTSLLNSFKSSSINNYQDIYTSSDSDPLTTIFTGYINNINESFSYETGAQVMQIACSGPTKKLTWTRILSNQAVNSKDSGSAIIPLSAYINPQSLDAEGKPTLENKDVITNLLVRVYSGLDSIKEIKDVKEKFDYNFDLNVNNTSSNELSNIQQKLDNAVSDEEKMQIQKQLKDYTSNLAKTVNLLREKYENLVSKYFLYFVKSKENSYEIKKNCCISDQLPLFVVEGTNQPAYQYTFNNFSLFQSNYNTAYQFIKSIADELMFNFYDDPYGTIHFKVPDLTLQHLQKNTLDPAQGLSTDPNVLNQIISYSQGQDTESIANVQPVTAKSIYNIDLSMINFVVKDYDLIRKYGEKMMQPFQMTGITNNEALKYATRMKMMKYNRKALCNIRVQCQAIPELKMDKYAYIKELKKLFYVESYSHSYQAGGQFSTSINGTYVREILTKAEVIKNDSYQNENSLKLVSTFDKNNVSNIFTSSFNKELKYSETWEQLNKLIDSMSYDLSIARETIWKEYVYNFGYPENVPDIKNDILKLYSKNNLSNCYLDGYFWKIPFEVDIYSIAKQIEEDEKIKLANRNKTFKIKKQTSVLKNLKVSKDDTKIVDDLKLNKDYLYATDLNNNQTIVRTKYPQNIISTISFSIKNLFKNSITNFLNFTINDKIGS